MDAGTWDQATPGKALDSCSCPTPLFSLSTRGINPRARTTSVPRRAEASQIDLFRLSFLSALIPCQNNKQVTANLLRAVLFRKTVHTFNSLAAAPEAPPCYS